MLQPAPVVCDVVISECLQCPPHASRVTAGQNLCYLVSVMSKVFMIDLNLVMNIVMFPSLLLGIKVFGRTCSSLFPPVVEVPFTLVLTDIWDQILLRCGLSSVLQDVWHDLVSTQQILVKCLSYHRKRNLQTLPDVLRKIQVALIVNHCSKAGPEKS